MSMPRPGTAVVMGVTPSWSFAAAIILLGLRDHLRAPCDVIVFHDGLSEGDMLLLNSIRTCRFEEFRIEVPFPEKFKRVSTMAFSRYECFGLLDAYDRVAWIDADALIVGNLDGLLSGTVTGMAMFQHENTPISVSFSSGVPGYDMDAPCFNDGIFVLDRSIGDGNALRSWCYRHTVEYHQHINSDQAVINLLLQANDIPVTKLDRKYNCHPVRPCEDAVILHPWGNSKFWNEYYDPRWDRYYREWVRLGGAPVAQYDGFKRRYHWENSLPGRTVRSLRNLLHL